MSLGIILTPDDRSKAYIQKCVGNRKRFDQIIFMNDERKEPIYDEKVIKTSKEYGFDISIPVKQTLRENNLTYTEFDFVDINDMKLKEYLRKINLDFIIFTGGGILKEGILSLKTKFIHMHPGLVPNYRGSTCFYYSILNEDETAVTCFIMDNTLDTGEILSQKKFKKPNHQYLDSIFDPHIRSEALIELLQNDLKSKERVSQDPNEGETYYIIHPVLKHIAILKCVND